MNQILGAANIVNNKNDRIQEEFRRAERWAKHARGLQNKLDNLSSNFDALSSRNERLEGLIKSMTSQGVASDALATIHTLKAESLQKQADEEKWPTRKRREANLKLAAEAEYDYRLKNDPSYRLNTCAASLMNIATYSDNADGIRKAVGQMFATGKVRKDEEKIRLVAERVEEMKKVARYADERATIPLIDSIPPARLEMDENDKDEYDSFSQVSAAHLKEGYWVQPNKIKPRIP